MFKKFLTTIILSMLVVSSVFAQPPTPPSENGYAPMPPTHRHRKMPRGDIYGLCRMAGINLSEQQINDINKTNYDYENKIREAEYRKRGIDYKFEFEREKADIDLKTIKDLINQRKDIEKEIDYLRIE
ncbi:hypothetical protein, partial [uncultured Brachyspira sp.]